LLDPVARLTPALELDFQGFPGLRFDVRRHKGYYCIRPG
jgi:hypothetical protein